MGLFLLGQTSHEVNIQLVVILSIVNSYYLLEMFPEHSEPEFLFLSTVDTVFFVSPLSEQLELSFS